VSVKKLRPFLIAEDWHPGGLLDRDNLRPLVAPSAEQLELFA
jgi:predicted DNA-binding helix-hairpin-helix protein